jgi:hypothetical protein
MKSLNVDDPYANEFPVDCTQEIHLNFNIVAMGKFVGYCRVLERPQ